MFFRFLSLQQFTSTSYPAYTYIHIVLYINTYFCVFAALFRMDQIQQVSDAMDKQKEHGGDIRLSHSVK